MDPEHARLVAAWLGGHVNGKQCGPHVDGPNHVCPRCIDRLAPPPLAHAVWLMLLDRTLSSGAPVAMPPNVAEVYLNDPRAYPADPCAGCGYLLPTQSAMRADGTYRHIGRYLGDGPVCGPDNYPEKEDDSR